MRVDTGGHRGLLGRERELALLSAAAAGATAGRGSLVLVEGPAGIGKTTLLRTACASTGPPGWQVLTARGLALEGGFSYGIVRQLIEPVRAAAGPGEWDALLDGAAALAARVFDWSEAGRPGSLAAVWAAWQQSERPGAGAVTPPAGRRR